MTIHQERLEMIRRLAKRIAALETALENVVSALPSEQSCDPCFWPIREQCRKVLEVRDGQQ